MKSKNILLSFSTSALLLSGCGGSGGESTQQNVETNIINQAPIIKNNIEPLIYNVKEGTFLILNKEEILFNFKDIEEDNMSLSLIAASPFTVEENENEFIINIPQVQENDKKEILFKAIDSLGNISESLKGEINIINEIYKIELKGDGVLDLILGEVYEEKGVSIYDSKGNIVIGSVIVTGVVNMTKEGEYEVVYTYKNEGKEYKVTRIVNVKKDTIKPEIDFLDHSQIMLTKEESYIEKDVIANDNIDGDISSKVDNNNQEIDFNSYGKKEINYNVKDSSGNIASIKDTIVISDKTISIIGVGGENLDNKYKEDSINPTFDIKTNYNISGDKDVKLKIEYNFVDTNTCNNFNEIDNNCTKSIFGQELNLSSVPLDTWININEKGHLYVMFEKKEDNLFNLTYYNENGKLLQGIEKITLKYGKNSYNESE